MVLFWYLLYMLLPTTEKYKLLLILLGYLHYFICVELWALLISRQPVQEAILQTQDFSLCLEHMRKVPYP